MANLLVPSVMWQASLPWFVILIRRFVQPSRRFTIFQPGKWLSGSTSNVYGRATIRTQSPGALLAANVAARIREFCTAPGMSANTLVRAAKLNPAELRLLEAERENMTRDMPSIAGFVGHVWDGG